MKIRVAFLSLLAISSSLVASAQVELDDMYFKSKDRAKLQASKPMTLKSFASEHEMATSANTINPTGSYSARNVNPEYISQSKVSSGVSEPAPYFIPDYAPTAVNQNLSKNYSYSNYNNLAMAGYNPYSYGGYGGMYSGFANPYNSFYSPMYGGYGYNPYGYGGYNSFYNSGWSSLLTFGFGMGSYYPYGGSAWGSPYYGWNNFYNTGYGYYPSYVVVNNDYYGSNVKYGKRVSRSNDLNNYVNPSNRSAAMITTTDSQGRVRGAAGGRVSGDDATSTYYQRGWRTNPETSSTATRSAWSTSGRTNDGSDNFWSNSGNNTNRTNSSFFDNSGSRSSSWNNSGSNSNFSSGAGSRSSGSVGGGSSGARRGRD